MEKMVIQLVDRWWIPFMKSNDADSFESLRIMPRHPSYSEEVKTWYNIEFYDGKKWDGTKWWRERKMAPLEYVYMGGEKVFYDARPIDYVDGMPIFMQIKVDMLPF